MESVLGFPAASSVIMLLNVSKRQKMPCANAWMRLLDAETHDGFRPVYSVIQYTLRLNVCQDVSL